MQLKKDTELSLKIVSFLAANVDQEVTVREISRESGIPKTIVSRLCSLLTEKEIVTRIPSTSEKNRYMIKNESLDKTLLDVIVAIEQQVDLFAIFDRSSELYLKCGNHFDDANVQISKLFSDMTIKDLMIN